MGGEGALVFDGKRQARLDFGARAVSFVMTDDRYDGRSLVVVFDPPALQPLFQLSTTSLTNVTGGRFGLTGRTVHDEAGAITFGCTAE